MNLVARVIASLTVSVGVIGCWELRAKEPFVGARLLLNPQFEEGLNARIQRMSDDEALLFFEFSQVAVHPPHYTARNLVARRFLGRGDTVVSFYSNHSGNCSIWISLLDRIRLFQGGSVMSVPARRMLEDLIRRESETNRTSKCLRQLHIFD